LLNEQIGMARKILQVFENNNISIEFTPSAVDDYPVILRQDQLKKNTIIGELINQLYDVLKEDTTIDFQENLASIVVVGKGMKDYLGIDADIQRVIADACVKLKFISFGSEQRCIVYGVNSQDGIKTVNSIYEKFLR
jgi:aspartate kinase